MTNMHVVVRIINNERNFLCVCVCVHLYTREGMRLLVSKQVVYCVYRPTSMLSAVLHVYTSCTCTTEQHVFWEAVSYTYNTRVLNDSIHVY